jgi:glyoxylase I family protein
VLLGFEHIGMTVSDLDRSLDFYVGKLGLKLVLRKAQTNGGEAAFLDAGGGMLEINSVAGAVRSRDVQKGEAGIRHLTLAYDDIGPIFEALEAAGVEIQERPRLAYFSDMLHRVAFVRDPDGIQVELLQRAEGR